MIRRFFSPDEAGAALLGSLKVDVGFIFFYLQVSEGERDAPFINVCV
jgi:hypothetical protein